MIVLRKEFDRNKIYKKAGIERSESYTEKTIFEE